MVLERTRSNIWIYSGKNNWILLFHILDKCCGIKLNQFLVWWLYFMSKNTHILNNVK